MLRQKLVLQIAITALILLSQNFFASGSNNDTRKPQLLTINEMQMALTVLSKPEDMKSSQRQDCIYMLESKWPSKDIVKTLPKISNLLLESQDFFVKNALLDVLYRMGKDAKPALPAIEACTKSNNKIICRSAKMIVDRLGNPNSDFYTTRRYVNNAKPIKLDEFNKLIKEIQLDDSSTENQEARINAAQQFYYRRLDSSVYCKIPEIGKIIETREELKLPLLTALASTGSKAKIVLPAIKKCTKSDDKLVRALAISLQKALEIPVTQPAIKDDCKPNKNSAKKTTSKPKSENKDKQKSATTDRN